MSILSNHKNNVLQKSSLINNNPHVFYTRLSFFSSSPPAGRFAEPLHAKCPSLQLIDTSAVLFMFGGRCLTAGGTAQVCKTNV